MNRRKILLGLIAFPVIAIAHPSSTSCPICGAPLVSAGSMKDDRSKPSRNIALWNRSYHGDFWPFFSDDSPICSRCFVAFRESDTTWIRSSEVQGSFYIPLSNSIAAFPVPEKSSVTSLVVYSQEFKGAAADGGCSESIAFWCRCSAQTLERMRDHSSKNGISLGMESQSMSSETYVTASAPNNSFKPKPLRGSA